MQEAALIETPQIATSKLYITENTNSPRVSRDISNNGTTAWRTIHGVSMASVQSFLASKVYDSHILDDAEEYLVLDKA